MGGTVKCYYYYFPLQQPAALIFHPSSALNWPLLSYRSYNPQKMAEILAHLTSASSELRAISNTRDERYDTQIRDLVAYIKNCDKDLDTQYLLDVSTARIFAGEGGRAWLVDSYARWYIRHAYEYDHLPRRTSIRHSTRYATF